MLLRQEQIRWEQIDPRITARVGAYIARTRSADASARPQIVQNSLHPIGEGMQASKTNHSPEGLAPAWTVVSFVAALFLVFLYLNACFNLMGPLATTMLSALPVGLAGIGTMAGIVEQGKGVHSPRLRGTVAPLDPTLRMALTETTTTRAEQLYSDVVLQLAADPTVKRPAHRLLRHDLLRQCNALLSDHFRIAMHRQHILKLIDDGKPLAQAEREALHLSERLNAETDVLARRSYDQSLEMCQERVEAMRGLIPMLARLDAHDELICQALSLARTAIARAEATPVALNAPDVEGLRTTVQRVLNQTRAMEEAMIELNEHTG